MIEIPRATYLLATRNREKFLPKAFENFREFIDPSQDEFIVIDGASTDHSLEIINQNHDLVSKVISEPDRGEAHAFNKGFLEARGQIIKVLSDDDYFYPEVMKKAIQLILSEKEIDALICAGRFMGRDHSVSHYQNYNASVPYASSVKNIFKYGACGLGLILRRSVLAWVGLFDTSFFSTDGEYAARLIEKRARFYFCRLHLFDHYTYETSGVVTGKLKLQNDWLRICVRNRMWNFALRYWAVWNVRSKIPLPFRYLWKLQDPRPCRDFWNDGALV